MAVVTLATLDAETRRRLERALGYTYEAIGHDCWGDAVPEDDEFVCVAVPRGVTLTAKG